MRLRGPTKKNLFRALRDDPRHTDSINIYKTGFRQLQGPGEPCWRTLPMASSGIAVGIWLSTKVDTVGGNPAPNNTAVRVTSPDYSLCVSLLVLFAVSQASSSYVEKVLCIADCIPFPQTLHSFVNDFVGSICIYIRSPRKSSADTTLPTINV